MGQKKFYHFLKWSSYTLLMLFCYVLQTTTSLFTLWGAKPLLTVILAVAIAMFEGEFAGAIFGALAGLFCDLGSGQLFGSNGLILMLCCFGVGLLVNALVRPTWLTSLLFAGGVLVVRGFFDFFFNMVLWGYDGVSHVLLTNILPVVTYSMALMPLFFLLMRRISTKFALILRVD